MLREENLESGRRDETRERVQEETAGDKMEPTLTSVISGEETDAVTGHKRRTGKKG